MQALKRGGYALSREDARMMPKCSTAQASSVSEEQGPISRIRHRVAIFVEPSPFSHISGMKNRFECLIKGLREAGDQVTVVTPDPKPPQEFCGAKVSRTTCMQTSPIMSFMSYLVIICKLLHQVVNVLGFKLPFYSSPTLLLSLGLSVRVFYHLMTQRPQIIHVSSPGLLVFAATLYAKLLRIPLVVSYHTHIPEYIPKYTWEGLVHPMWSIIRWCTRASDLTLVTSAAMQVRSNIVEDC
jgi:sulfoquinovosyltransferase